MGRPLKLEKYQIVYICNSNESARELAKKYGVSYITILNYRKKYGKQVHQGVEADTNVV